MVGITVGGFSFSFPGKTEQYHFRNGENVLKCGSQILAAWESNSDSWAPARESLWCRGSGWGPQCASLNKLWWGGDVGAAGLGPHSENCCSGAPPSDLWASPRAKFDAGTWLPAWLHLASSTSRNCLWGSQSLELKPC